MDQQPPKDPRSGEITQDLPAVQAPAEVTWATLEAPPPPPAAPVVLATSESTPATRWTKALLPVAVLLLYGALKLFQGFEAREPRGPELSDQPQTLSGVKRDTETGLSRPQRELVARLEGLAAANQWKALREAIAAADPETADHPIVRAFDLIARAELGPRTPALANELEEARAALGTSGRHRELAERLALAEARSLLSLFRDAQAKDEYFMRTEERIQRLVRPLPLRPGVLSLRIELARRYEAFGDQQLEAGRGRFGMGDEATLRAARGYYQTALRWIVADTQWHAATPIDPTAAPHVQRILGRMAEVNRSLNGALTRVMGDPTTWTGQRGDPIHDAPAPGSRR